MLFDLRSRGRRSTVRVIYLFLAITMVVGLVGLGIGTGNTGGLLNAGTNSGSGGNGSQLAEREVKSALEAVRKHPTAANWAALLEARWTAAGSGSNYNTAKSTYTASGRRELERAAAAWQKYLVASGYKPQLQYAILAAGVYQNISQWAQEADAWNYAAQAAPPAEQLKPYLCLALSAYAANETTKGNLAAAKAVQLTPKLQRFTQKSTLQSAAANASTAQVNVVADC
jgi:hypothetical protein